MIGGWPLVAAGLAAAPASAQGAGEEPRWTIPKIVGQRCRAEGDEIVVCGRRDPDRYRVKDLGATARDEGERRLGVTSPTGCGPRSSRLP